MLNEPLEPANDLDPEAGRSGVNIPPSDCCPFTGVGERFLGLGDFLPLPFKLGNLLSLDLSSGVLGPDDFAELGCFIRFRDLMVSVFNEMGRGRPCNLRNNPQALHKTWPVSSLLQSGVVWVLQFRHTGVDMFVLDVVVPLFMWVVDLALGCTGLVGGTGAGSRSIWFIFIGC